MSASRYVHLSVDEILRETDAAFLLRLIDQEEVWVPKSQVADPECYEVGDNDFEIAVTEWIARQKGLEGESS